MERVSAASRVIAASIVAVLVAAAPPERAVGEEDEFADVRDRMVDKIEDIAGAVGPVDGRGGIDAAVLAAMRRVPRHLFVPDELVDLAYADRPLPIGYGQTISQPYIVALMTDLLDLEPDHVALELGTGSAYQAAILGELVSRAYSIEIVPELAAQAAARLARLGYENVTAREGDGYYGWPEHAPFDAIIVTAAASHVPPPLVKQLKPGGRMIIPVGSRFSVQHLLLVEKEAEGAVRTRQLLPVRFVPLTGGH